MDKTATPGTRIAPHYRIHLVLNATQDSVLADVLTETTLAELGAMFRGGLSAERNPTVYTRREEAERDARARLALLTPDGDLRGFVERAVLGHAWLAGRTPTRVKRHESRDDASPGSAVLTPKPPHASAPAWHRRSAMHSASTGPRTRRSVKGEGHAGERDGGESVATGEEHAAFSRQPVGGERAPRRVVRFEERVGQGLDGRTPLGAERVEHRRRLGHADTRTREVETPERDAVAGTFDLGAIRAAVAPGSEAPQIAASAQEFSARAPAVNFGRRGSPRCSWFDDIGQSRSL